MVNATYDHLAIVVDEENILHVAPPKVRLLSSDVLLMKKRNPLILRLNMTEEEKSRIITDLMREIGTDYDYARVLKLTPTVFLYRVLQIEPLFGAYDKKVLDEKHSLCSDLIINAILKNSPPAKTFIEKNFEQFAISKHGSFSPDDFKLMAELPSSFLKKVIETPLFVQEESESKIEILSDRIFANVEILRKIKEFVKQNDPFRKRTIIVLKVIKYLLIHEIIPGQRELLAALLPLNKRIIEFVLFSFRLREFYKDTTKHNWTKLVLSKLFPVLFMMTTKMLDKDDLDILLKKLETIHREKLNSLVTRLIALKRKFIKL